MTAQTLILPGSERSELARWAFAAAFVLVMHTGLMAGYFLLAPEEREGTTDSNAILVDLAPITVAPSSPDDETPGPPSVEAMPTPKPPPQAKEEIAEPIEKAEAPSDVTLPLPEPKAEEQKKSEDPDKEEVKTEVEHQQQVPSPVTAAAPRSDQQAAVQPQAALRGADQASVDITKRWQHLVAARLQQKLRYPKGAAPTRDTNTVFVRFIVDPDGKVQSKSIVRSSGVPALDQEALATLERTQLPPFFAGMKQSSIAITVPVGFDR